MQSFDELFSSMYFVLVNNRSQSFTLSGNSALAVQAMVGSQGANSCPLDYIIIPCASNVGRAINAVPACQDRLCGGTFSAEVSLNPATVQSKYDIQAYFVTQLLFIISWHIYIPSCLSPLHKINMKHCLTAAILFINRPDCHSFEYMRSKIY